MTDKELDAILNRLISASEHKKQIKLTKANAEIETIRREAEAYWDGVYDALKEVKNERYAEKAALMIPTLFSDS